MEKIATKVGENVMVRTVRLLGRLNAAIADPDVPGMESVKLLVTAAGKFSILDSDGGELITLHSEEQLSKFLTGPLPLQVRAIRSGCVEYRK